MYEITKYMFYFNLGINVEMTGLFACKSVLIVKANILKNIEVVFSFKFVLFCDFPEIFTVILEHTRTFVTPIRECFIKNFILNKLNQHIDQLSTKSTKANKTKWLNIELNFSTPFEISNSRAPGIP